MLTKILNSEGLKTDVIVDALDVIALYGVEAKSAVPVLIQHLSHSNSKIRIHATQAIQSLGPEAKTAVPKLIERLEDMGTMPTVYQTPPLFITTKGKSDPVRVYAMKALAAIGTSAKPAIPKLLEAVRTSRNEFVAAESLIAISPKEGEHFLLGLLRDNDSENDFAAFHGLQNVRTPETFQFLAKAIESAHPEHSGDAYGLLIQFGPQALPYLVLGLKNPYENTWALSCGFVGSTPIRTLATRTLAKMQQAGHTALLKALNSQDLELRARAAECLVQIGPYEDRVLPVFIDILKRSQDIQTPDYVGVEQQNKKYVAVIKTTTIKSIALNTLSKFGEKAKPAISAIRPLLKQKQLKLLAASTLDAIVPGDTESIKLLKPEVQPLHQKLLQEKESLYDDKKYVSRFTKLGTPAVPVLISLLSSNNEDYRQIAITALGQLARRSEPARKAIIVKAENVIKLKKPINHELLRAVSFLPSEESLPLLKRLLLQAYKIESYPTQNEIFYFLGADGLRLIHNLGKIKSKDQIYRVIQALGKYLNEESSLLKEKRESIMILLETMSDPEVDNSLKGDLSKLLARLKPEPRIAVPAILKVMEFFEAKTTESLIDSKNPYLSCIESLGSFGPKAKSAVPILVKLLADPKLSKEAELSVIEALAAIGPAAKPALPFLIAKFQPDKKIAPPDEALVGIGREAVLRIQPFLQHELVEMRLRAIKILARIGRDASPALAQIRNRLVNDPRLTVRIAAAEALGQMESKDSPSQLSIKALRTAQKDSSLTVRLAAEKSLRQLGK
ncbi:MAG: hypothetical protein Tsb009_01590 [Planctomycetaceae bacterium]